MVKTFKVGDKVFAKVKGYPHWPARIVEDKGKKYGVIFYGTQETGNIKAEDIVYYLKNKESFLKHSKRAGYADALEQIDAAVKKDGGDGDNNPNDDSGTKIIDESMDSTDTSINTPKTTEKKANKRKVSSGPEEITPASVTKSARGRKSAVTEVKESEESTPKRAKRRTASSAKENVEEKKGDINNEDIKVENDIDKPEVKKDSTPPKKARGRPSTKDKNKPAKPDDSNPGENSQNAAEEPIKTDEVKEPEFVSMGENETATVEEEVPIKIEEAIIVEDEKPVKENSTFKPVIVTEKLLKNNVLYAEHVRKNEALYKSLPVEHRPEDAENQAFPVPLPSGTVCGIKLHKKWPLDEFQNEYDRALYDETVAKTALDHRDKLVAGGEISSLEDADMIVEKLAVTTDNIKEVAYKKDIESQKKRIDRLNVEGNLVAIDGKIKQCLGLETADPEAALDHLKEMLKIKFDELMLKKHVHVVDMIRRLQKYIGNTKEWNMSDDDIEDFQKKAEKIRLEAEKVYNKIKEAVTIPEGSTNFWDGFLEIVSNFRKECKNLSDDQRNVLCAEPNSRKAFFHQLEEISTDTVISNGVSNSEAVLNKTDEHSSSVQGWAEKSL